MISARILPLLLVAWLLPAPSAPAAITVTGEAVWQGVVQLPEGAIVPAGSSLRLLPGTRINLGGEGIRIEGTLTVAGTAASPVVIDAGDPVAGGEANALPVILSIVSKEKQGLIEHLRLLGDGDGMVVNGSVVHLKNVTVKASGDAVRVENDGRADGSDLDLWGYRRGLAIVLRSSALLARVRVSGPKNGIDVVTGGSLGLTGGTIRSGETGVWMQQMERGFLDGVEFLNCRTGLSAHSVGPKVILKNLRFVGCGDGIYLNAFSVPTIEWCLFSGGTRGIVVANYSAPLIGNSTLAGNATGIFINQKSTPVISACCLQGNAVGVEADFSSYPRINFNSFSENRVALRLGETQSADWERRHGSWNLTKGQAIGSGSKRITKENTEGRRAETLPVPQNNFLDGWVDVRWNWWGEADTAVILSRGANVNLPMVDDGHDRPSVAYEGYPGRYRLDRFELWPVLEEPWEGTPPCP